MLGLGLAAAVTLDMPRRSGKGERIVGRRTNGRSAVEAKHAVNDVGGRPGLAEEKPRLTNNGDVGGRVTNFPRS